MHMTLGVSWRSRDGFGFQVRHLQTTPERPALDSRSSRPGGSSGKMPLEAANSPGEYFIFLQGEGVVAKYATTVFEEQADAV